MRSLFNVVSRPKGISYPNQVLPSLTVMFTGQLCLVEKSVFSMLILLPRRLNSCLLSNILSLQTYIPK